MAGFDPYAQDFVAHYGSIRGRVRLALLHEQVAARLDPTSRVLDVGGGAGHLAVLLAQNGHAVDVLEPSVAMRAEAADLIAAVPDDVAARVNVIAGGYEQIASMEDVGGYDAVLCHAVAPYVHDLAALVDAVVSGARPGGLLSVVVKNRESLAVRPALEGRWRDALAAFDADGDAGGLGVRNHAHSIEDVQSAFCAAGATPDVWFGIRLVSDGLSPEDQTTSYDDVLAVERETAIRDPYRALGRLLHVTAVRDG